MGEGVYKRFCGSDRSVDYAILCDFDRILPVLYIHNTHFEDPNFYLFSHFQANLNRVYSFFMRYLERKAE